MKRRLMIAALAASLLAITPFAAMAQTSAVAPPSYAPGEYVKIDFRLDGPELPVGAVVSVTFQTIPPTTYAGTTLRVGSFTLTGTREDAASGRITVRGQIPPGWPGDPTMTAHMQIISGQIASTSRAWNPVALNLANLNQQLAGRWPQPYSPPTAPPPPPLPSPPPLPHVPPRR